MAPRPGLAIYVLAWLLAAVGLVGAQTTGFDPISSPTQDETVAAGSTLDIVWSPSSDYSGTVSLTLLGGQSASNLATLQTLASGVDNLAGKYVWTIPTSLGDEATYGIQITLDSDSSVFQYSFPFHISASGGGSGSSATTTTTSAVTTTPPATTSPATTTPATTTPATTTPRPTPPTTTAKSSGNEYPSPNTTPGASPIDPAQPTPPPAPSDGPGAAPPQSASGGSGSAGGGRLSSGAIAGIAVGCAGLVIIVVALLFLTLHYRRKAQAAARHGGFAEGLEAELDGSAAKPAALFEMGGEKGSAGAELYGDGHQVELPVQRHVSGDPVELYGSSPAPPPQRGWRQS